MSFDKSELAKDQVIPVFQSDLFAENPDKRFAVGMLAVHDVPLEGLETPYRAYYDLRVNSYVFETGQLAHDDIQLDGTDRDIDDRRSVAFGAFENIGAGLVRGVGTLRLIIKGEGSDHDEHRPLPIEEFCPEVFPEPAADHATEVSRLVARHERAAVQDLLKWKMYGVGLAYIANHGLGPTYAVIEPELERHFNGSIPVSRIGNPRHIDHYLAVNLPIKVHTQEFMATTEARHPGLLERMRREEGLLGYYGRAAVQATSLEPKLAATA